MILREQTEERKPGGPAKKCQIVLPNEALWLLPWDPEIGREAMSLPPGKDGAERVGSKRGTDDSETEPGEIWGNLPAFPGTATFPLLSLSWEEKKKASHSASMGPGWGHMELNQRHGARQALEGMLNSHRRDGG